MAITKPLIFTPIEDIEVSFNRPVSEETIRKMIQNANMLSLLALVGSIRCVALNQHGVTTPSTDQLQLATGSQITHPQSPITSISPTDRFTPNFQNVYPRGAANDSDNGTGGTYTTDLSHYHQTDFYHQFAYGENGDEQKAYIGGHDHTISVDLNSEEPLEVAHQEVAIYLKIN